jgi:signal peptidase II
MQKVNRLPDKLWSVFFLLIGLLVLVTDQLSKAWIRASLLEGQSLFKLGFFRITYVHNTGAAFGLFQDQSFVLTIVAIIAIVIVLVCGLFISRSFPWLEGKLSKSALGLLLGGTVGNLIDRLRLGYVTDFIDFSYWPAFNLADASVTVGVILFAYSLLRSAKIEKH